MPTRSELGVVQLLQEDISAEETDQASLPTTTAQLAQASGSPSAVPGPAGDGQKHEFSGPTAPRNSRGGAQQAVS